MTPWLPLAHRACAARHPRSSRGSMSHKIVVSVRVAAARGDRRERRASGAGGVSIAGRRVTVQFGRRRRRPVDGARGDRGALLGQLMEGHLHAKLAYGQTPGKSTRSSGRRAASRSVGRAAAGGDRGLFPRLVLEILAPPKVLPSAIEVYSRVRAQRPRLTVGKSAGLKVGGSGPAIMCGAGAALASSAPARRARRARRPPGCSCGKCIVAQEKALEALKACARSGAGRRGGGGARPGGGRASATVETVVPLASAATRPRARRRGSARATRQRARRARTASHPRIAERRGARRAQALLVVDLAGSSASSSRASRAAQDQAINGSLTGSARSSLGRREAHVPSATRRLRASLGGRARTAVVTSRRARRRDRVLARVRHAHGRGPHRRDRRRRHRPAARSRTCARSARRRARGSAARREGHGEWWSDDPNHASGSRHPREHAAAGGGGRGGGARAEPAERGRARVPRPRRSGGPWRRRRRARGASRSTKDGQGVRESWRSSRSAPTARPRPRTRRRPPRSGSLMLHARRPQADPHCSEGGPHACWASNRHAPCPGSSTRSGAAWGF